jgi:hypothetical protein
MSVTQHTSAPPRPGNWDKVAELVHTFANCREPNRGKKDEGIMGES